MQVLEIKNNLVKIAYDVKDNLALSGFVIIEDTNSPYVAQVVNVKADKLTNFAIVKLLFTFNEDGILKNYNGTIPSLKSTVSVLPSKELLDIIPVEKPLVIGQIAQQDVTLKVDRTILDNNLLICSDNVENTNILIDNIIRQIEEDEKVVIFDTDGQFEAENKVVFGQDFRLPLNYNTINFIYENELDDVDATSKAVIQDVFIEVQEYTRTLPEGYLPFETFINVVDQQYRETQIPQLILLKNKLLKYKEVNAFAETLKDVMSLSITIENTPVTVIDISDMTPILQKEIIAYAYGVMNGIDGNIYSFVSVDNTNSSKKLLKTFLSRDSVYTTIVCRHEYKYLPELKSSAQNLILFAPQTLQHDFAAYNTFLNKLNPDEYIVYGAHTQNIPLIVELDELVLEKKTDESDDDEESAPTPNVVPMPEAVNNKQQAPENSLSENNAKNEQVTKNVNSVNEEIAEPKNNFEAPNVEYPDLAIEDNIPFSNEVEEGFPQEEVSFSETDSIQSEPVAEIIEDSELDELGDIQAEIPEPVIEDNQVTEDFSDVSIDNGETFDSPIVEDYEQINDTKNAPVYNILDEMDVEASEEPEVLPLESEVDYSVEDSDIEENYQEPEFYSDENEAMIQQAAKDVDKLIYEKLPEEEVTLNDLSDLQSDELTEDDLNLIGDLTSDNSADDAEADIQDYQAAAEEESMQQEQPPVVPIYNADDIEYNEPQALEPGDRVSTPKYGEGIVQKMIKYGNKKLCSIEFPNIGRRLLDPAMTEINKL